MCENMEAELSIPPPSARSSSNRKTLAQINIYCQELHNTANTEATR